MADDNTLANLPQLISDLVVFGIRVLGNVTRSAEALVAQILSLPQVLEELQKQLNRITQLHFNTIRQRQVGKALIDALRTPGLRPSSGMSLAMRPDEPPLQQASALPANALTQALLGKVKELDAALNKGGIWYDRATYTLYLVASGAT